jgi:hypothetical protein
MADFRGFARLSGVVEESAATYASAGKALKSPTFFRPTGYKSMLYAPSNGF